MAEQKTGEARAESEDSKTEEAAEERRKIQRKSERTPWEVLGRWNPRKIDAEELDAAILERGRRNC